MKTFKRVALGALALFILFAILILWKLPEQELKRIKLQYEMGSPEESLLNHEKQIMADRELVEKVDFFRGSKGERDAGPFLNPIIHWEDQAPAKLSLPKDLREKLREKEWVALEPDFKSLDLDFSWMARLKDFDYWDPHRNNQLVDLSQKPHPMSLPFPNYRELSNWAKLRLIHGRLTKTMPEALREVRQLSRLIFTQDTLVSTVVALGILQEEGVFVQNYNPKIFREWKTIPQETLQVAKRYLWAGPVFVDARLPDATYELFSGGNVGKCQMISESMVDYLVIKERLQNIYPGVLKRFSRTVKNSLESCRKSVSHEMWEDPEWKVWIYTPDSEKSLLKAENESDWKRRILEIHPLALELEGYLLLTIASPYHLKLYDELSPKKD